MKKIGVLPLAFIYAGCFLGAGCVSGQEIFQFFGSFGFKGILGILIAVAIEFVIGVMVIKFVQKTGTIEFDKIMVCADIPWMRKTLGFIITFFMVGVIVIITAGAGALFKQMFDISSVLMSGVFCLLIILISFKGVDGFVSVFSKAVPFLVVGAVIISIVYFVENKGNFALENLSSNPLLNNWVIGGITYASYNLILTVGIIAPIANRVESKNVVPGIFLGCLMVFAVASFIFCAISKSPDMATAQLPMLQVACDIGKVVGIIYAILLLMGMFGVALSTYVAVLVFIKEKWQIKKKTENITTIIMGVVVWICSLAGFGNLVGTVYPICGYLGFAGIIGIIVTYYKNKKIDR